MARLYIWERPAWPRLHYQASDLLQALSAARQKQGELRASMRQLGFDQQAAAYLETLTTDAIETSEIEGQHVDYAAVRSSVAERLGMPEAAVAPKDARAAGIAEMTVDATRDFAKPLTAERLFAWHAGLFPNVRSEGKEIAVGAWRRGAIGVYSPNRKNGSTITHYIAPPADRVTVEMHHFLKWFAQPHDDGLLRSGLAHLWFVTIHPLEDGNGRIARAIADMALAQDDQSAQRFFSMSRQIRIEQNAYYDILEATQTGDTDVTDWLKWFLRCYANAIDTAQSTMANVLQASRFWATHAGVTVNERQRKVINMVLNGYDGKITSKSWSRFTGASKETAIRDIGELITHKILRQHGAGRATHYELLGAMKGREAN
jgi:Fic family protein